MPIRLSPIPNFNVQTPDILGAQLQQAQLKDLMGRQQLLPLQVQEAQQRIQSGGLSMQQQQLAIQDQQMKLKSRQAMIDAWSDPDFASSATGNSGNAPSMFGFDPGFNPQALIKKLVEKHVLPEDATAYAAQLLDISKQLSMKRKDDLSNYKEAHKEAANVLISAQDAKPEDAPQALAAAKIQIARIPGLDPADIQHVQQVDKQHLPALINTLGFANDLAEHHLKQAQATEAEAGASIKKAEAAEKGSPLTKMENDPTMFAGEKLPASIAYLEGKVKDSDPAVAARATRLLSTAKTAQSVELAINAAKKATDQAITQGSPTAAAQLLISGDATLSQLKARGSTPEFIANTLSEARRLSNGTFNAQQAEASFDVAKSPANVAFFGSAKSLTDKGGTLDQLKAAGDDIPQNKFPVFNTVADAIKASTGSGPIAKYAAIALGVADDYSKVMGGGQGSDTSRLQALKLISAKASPEQRAASIEGIRGAVGSQTNSRIGNNPVLRKMYGTAAGATVRMRAPNGQEKDVSPDQVEHYKSMGAKVIQ